MAVIQNAALEPFISHTVLIAAAGHCLGMNLVPQWFSSRNGKRSFEEEA